MAEAQVEGAGEASLVLLESDAKTAATPGGKDRAVRPHFLPLVTETTSQANTIQMCVQEMILVERRPSEGATVTCYDYDPFNEDDLMAEGFTDANGCVTLTYEDLSWDGGGLGGGPDILCVATKLGFETAAPPDKDGHDTSTLADFGEVTLYRDRRGDFGHFNGCGPKETDAINGIGNWLLRFDHTCHMHDKCYWDCQIFLGMNSDPFEGMKFCTDEMYEGMKSWCYMHRDRFSLVGEGSCLWWAETIYNGLIDSGADAYPRTAEKCPNENGELHPSMRNDYSHPDCYLPGYHCGYNSNDADDLDRCSSCCVPDVVTNNEYPVNERYCECLGGGAKCGTTRFGRVHNVCDRCCMNETFIDDGWTYDDIYCEAKY